MEIMKGTPWSRIKRSNNVKKEVLEIVGSGKPTDSVLKETIAVSDTISTSVQNRHSRILLQDLLRSRVWTMHREPEVLEAEAQVGKITRLPCKDSPKELVQLHFLKNGILQSACSTSPKMSANLGMSAPRLTNSSARSPKESWQKCSGCVEEYTTIGLRISGCGAAEVFTDFAEELKHTEAKPMQHSGPKTHRLE